jgi:hypothetical protein
LVLTQTIQCAWKPANWSGPNPEEEDILIEFIDPEVISALKIFAVG